MCFEGHVENGRIVLDEPTQLPEGAKVRVEVMASEALPAVIPSLYERLKSFAGVLDDLPNDAASNHDHYLYGAPRKP